MARDLRTLRTERRTFNEMAVSFGISTDAYRTVINYWGTKYEIVGINPKARTRNVIVRDMETKRCWRFYPADVRQRLPRHLLTRKPRADRGKARGSRKAA